MSEEYGNDIITLTDDDGQEYELEHMDTLEHNGAIYLSFIPADADFESDEIDFIILKNIEEDGEEMLVTIEDDEEMEQVYELFMKRIEEIGDEECDCEECGHDHSRA